MPKELLIEVPRDTIETLSRRALIGATQIFPRQHKSPPEHTGGSSIIQFGWKPQKQQKYRLPGLEYQDILIRSRNDDHRTRHTLVSH